MSDGVAPASAPAAVAPAPEGNQPAPGAAPNVEGAQPSEGNQPEPVMPEWMKGLPERLQGDPTLARYNDLEALANGHLETKRNLSEKKALPDFTSDDGYKAFVEQVRPATADVYDIPVNDTTPAAEVDAARKMFHDAGLLPQQAKVIMDANAAFAAEQAAALQAAQADELQAFKTRYNQSGRDYDKQLVAAQEMLKATGVDGDAINDFESKFGTGPMMEMLFNFADRFGEQGRLQGDGAGGVAGVTPENAKEVWNAKLNDPEWLKQSKVEGTPQHAEAKRLMALVAQNEKR